MAVCAGVRLCRCKAAVLRLRCVMNTGCVPQHPHLRFGSSSFPLCSPCCGGTGWADICDVASRGLSLVFIIATQVYESAYSALIAGDNTHAAKLLGTTTSFSSRDKAWAALRQQREHLQSSAAGPWDGVLHFPEK